EAAVRAGADRLELVPGGHFERDPAAVDRRHGCGDFHFHTQQRRGQVLDCNLHANRILARIRIFEQQLTTRLFDIPDEERRRVYAGLLAHEVDGAVAVDFDAVEVRRSRL